VRPPLVAPMTYTASVPASVPASAPASTRTVALDLVLAVAIGSLCYWGSCFLVWPDATSKGFGIQWEMMSQDPFGLVGQLPQRILAPLLGWLSGCGGQPHYVPFTRGLAVFFLATIAFYCRRRGANAVDAALVTAAVALTSPIQMYKWHWVGYSDPLQYALCFWMLLASKRSAPLFWGLYLLNLLTHELAVFLLPWFWFVRREAAMPRRGDAIGAAVSVGLYLAFYQWVKANAQQQAYSADYFLSHPLFPGGSVVVWALAGVHWVVAFGPILAVIAWHQHRPEFGSERRHLWLVLAGIVVIFCIAFDWNRHSNLVVIPMVLAALRFLAAGHRVAFVALAALGAWLMTRWNPWPSVSWPTHTVVDPAILNGVVVLLPDGSYGFGPLRAALQGWLPVVSPTLAVIGAIGAAIWATGFALARGRKAAPRVAS
jgi:hypothetical protein